MESGGEGRRAPWSALFAGRRRPSPTRPARPRAPQVDSLDELIYVESHMCNTGTKYYGELTEQIVKNKDSPGSDNGTGLFQTICSFKIREAYEAITKSK